MNIIYALLGAFSGLPAWTRWVFVALSLAVTLGVSSFFDTKIGIIIVIAIVVIGALGGMLWSVMRRKRDEGGSTWGSEAREPRWNAPRDDAGAARRSELEAMQRTSSHMESRPSQSPRQPAEAPALLGLVDLCEPLFQYVCMLNRVARNPGGEGMEYPALRKVIDGMFKEMEEYAGADLRLEAQYGKVKMPLIFFVDSMIAESRLGLASTWNKKRIAYEMEELAGDEKFFDLLDETLKETGKEAEERLAIYYTCLGLGFTGWYTGQNEYLRKKMLDVGQRVPRELLDTQHTAKVCPEAYDYLDTRNLVEPPGMKMATIGVVFAGCLLIAFAVNFYLFYDATTGLSASLKEILKHDLLPK